MASSSGPLEAMLRSAGVPVGRYDVALSSAAVDELRRDRRDAHDPEDAVGLLIEALRAAPHIETLPPLVTKATASLIDHLRGAHVVSFTNHESMARNDFLLTECARLASPGVQVLSRHETP